MTLSDDSSDSSASAGTGSANEEVVVEEEYIEDEIVEDEEEYLEEEYVEDEIIEDEEIVDGGDQGGEEQGDIVQAGSADNPINLEDADLEDVQDPEAEEDFDEESEGEEELREVDLGDGGDVESQVRDAPRGEKFVAQKKPSKSQCWFWLCCFFVLGLLGGGGYLGYWLTEEQDDALDRAILNSPTADPGPTAAPTVAAVTMFDPVVGACDTLGATPHPIDQCSCSGAIQTIPEDVIARYNFHLFSFVPALYNDEWTVTNITDCAPQNQALVWLSSGNDYEFTTEEREQRFALATMFVSAQGARWTQKQDWLSGWDSCRWYGVTCEGETVREISLEQNRIEGMVSSYF